MVEIDDEPALIGVKPLSPIDIGDGNRKQLELEIHTDSLEAACSRIKDRLP